MPELTLPLLDMRDIARLREVYGSAEARLQNLPAFTPRREEAELERLVELLSCALIVAAGQQRRA